MAYLLPKIDQATGTGQNNQSNIFQSSQPQQMPQSQNSGSEKTSNADGGAISSGGSKPSAGVGGGMAQPPKAAAPGARPAQAFGGTMSANGLGSGIGQSIQQNQDRLSSEATGYVAGAQAKDYNIAVPKIDQAVAGDQAAQGEVGGLLAGRKENVSADPFKTTANAQTGADRLKTDAGVGSLLNEQADSRYSAGERNLDLALLGKNQDWSAQRQGMLDRQGVLEKGMGAEAVKGLQDQATGILQGKYGAAQEAVRTDLGGRASALEATQQKEADAENLIRQGMKPKDAYETINGPVTAAQAWDDKEALQFNNIQGLLGTNKIATVGGFGAQTSYDNARLETDRETQRKAIENERIRKAEEDKKKGKRNTSVDNDPMQILNPDPVIGFGLDASESYIPGVREVRNSDSGKKVENYVRGRVKPKLPKL